MLKLGSQSISTVRLGGAKIRKAYLGDTVVFDTSKPPVPTYTVSASIDPADSGTVSGAGTYQAGETVTVTAKPGDGYKFAGWQENGVVVSEDEAYSFAVTGDRALTAVFELASLLPGGYTQLEYIECPDTLNTNYLPYIVIPATANAAIIEVQFSSGYKNTAVTLQAPISRQVSTSSSNTVYAVGLGTSTGSSNVFSVVTYHGVTTSSASAKDLLDASVNTLYTVRDDPQNKQTTVNGVVYNHSGGKTLWMAASINLFYSTADYATRVGSPRLLRIYSVKWFDASGNLLRSLVPVKNASGVLGMFDFVTQTFFKNGNTSSKALDFIAGPLV